jgi:hypothetical protein
MNILQSIIKKAKEVTAEARFTLNWKRYVRGYEENVETFKAKMEKAILDGSASDAYYYHREMQEAIEALNKRKEFEKFFLANTK